MNRPSLKKFFYVFISFFILIVFSFFAVCLGSKFINPFSIITKELSKTELFIITQIRIPRILLSVICGALLGGTGAVFQGLFRNPLADPGIMGISSGATFGAVLSGFFPITAFTFLSPVSLFAFGGALLSALCVFLFSKIFREASSVTLLLSGTAVGTFFSAIASIILIMNERDLHSFYIWTTGSFNAKGWNELLVFLIPSVISLIALQLCAKHLDILVCGEQSAMTFGLDYSVVRNFVLLAGSLAASCAVCAGGIISFVGLIAPHIARRIYGPKHRTLIFESILFGGILMLLADTIARTVISPSELPVGIITSLIGVPCFIVALVKMNGGKK